MRQMCWPCISGFAALPVELRLPIFVMFCRKNIANDEEIFPLPLEVERRK